MPNLIDYEKEFKAIDAEFQPNFKLWKEGGDSVDYTKMSVDGSDQETKQANFYKQMEEWTISERKWKGEKALVELEEREKREEKMHEGITPGLKAGNTNFRSLKSIVAEAPERDAAGRREPMKIVLDESQHGRGGMKALFALTGQTPANNLDDVSGPSFATDMDILALFTTIPMAERSSLYMLDISRGSVRASVHARNSGAVTEAAVAATNRKYDAETVSIASPIDNGILRDNGQLESEIGRVLNGEVVAEMADMAINGSGASNQWAGLLTQRAATNLAADVANNGMLQWFRGRIRFMRANGVPVDYCLAPLAVVDKLDDDMVTKGYRPDGLAMGSGYPVVNGVTVIPTTHLSDSGLKSVVFGAFGASARLGIQSDVNVETDRSEKFSNFQTVIRADMSGAVGFHQVGSAAGDGAHFQVYKETADNTFGT